MHETLYICGCGGHARSIISTIRMNNETYSVILIDKNARDGEQIMGCDIKKAYEFGKNDCCIVGIGNNCERKKMFEDIQKGGNAIFSSIISKQAIVAESIIIGEGVFVSPNAYIGPQVEIGDNTIINTASIIEHECKIGNHVHIAPHATICGRSIIGDMVFCGAGSTIIDKISVCNDVIIGAGAVVIKDICEPGIYVGIPARRVRNVKK